MKTHILPIEDISSVKLCAEQIRSGGIVAFPTETVYGLGVSAYKGESVKKVFEVKGRPSDNPLICHVADIEDAVLATDELTATAKKLFKAFSPGPLTCVVKKNSKISDEVTAGLDTVGIRIVKPEGARRFLKECGVPVAAPSANTSKRPSPTTAMDVLADMDGKIEYILDGGDCEVGIESTVVDCRGETPIVLRAGKITSEDIKRVCGSVKIAGSTDEVRSPGMKYRHYCPKCTMYCRFEKTDGLQDKINELAKKGEKVVLIGNGETKTIENVEHIVLGESVEDFMHGYFSSLRRAEKVGSVIVCYIPFKECEAEGLYNRATKSCGGNLI